MWITRYARYFAGGILLIILALALSATISAQDTILSAAHTNNGFPTLVGPDGRTLYTLALDDEGESTCYDACAEEWPPLTVAEGVALNAGDGVPGAIGTTRRDHGSLQVTYEGWPLYYFDEDAAPGDDKGQGMHDIWFVASPATVMLDLNANFLVGPGGKTLYVFTEDEDGESYCYRECAVAWPPLIVPAGAQPLAGGRVPGELGTVEREDGLTQVTYNGLPLYFFKGDEFPGDTRGHGLKDVWFILSPQGTFQGQSSEDNAAATTEAESGAAPMATVEAAPMATVEAGNAGGAATPMAPADTPQAPAAEPTKSY
jgi:predicted lipoprotein with Yx(FWY)xxD motif